MDRSFKAALLTILISVSLALPLWSANNQVAPIVVFIHGRDQAGQNPDELRRLWFEAFDEGQKALGVPQLVSNEDRTFVWYGDIYGKNPPPTPEDCKYAAEVETETIGERLRRTLIKIATKANLDKIAYDLFVNDTFRFFSDITYRCSTEHRLEQVLNKAHLEQRPIILVAHSMGAIVAFGVLQANSQSVANNRYNLVQLVTAGTQVGVPEILQATQGSLVKPPVPVPQNVKRWTNISNRGDKLAFSAKGKFKATDKNREPVEVRLNTPGNARHSIALYLSSQETTKIILSAWCNALATPLKDSKPGCQKVLGSS